MTTNKKITISIVLYKTPLDQLERCICSLQKIKQSSIVCIIDNSPINNYAELLNKYLNIIYIHNPSNPGFGAAHNKAIRILKQTNAEFHLVINADVHFDSDVISPMICYMVLNNEVGLMMPKIFNSDGTIQRLCKLVPSPQDLLLRRSFFRKLKILSNCNFELHASGYDKIMFVPYLSGCFMLTRHKVLAEVGFFDERFFMYPEDMDLTRRIAERYETIFFPEVSVFHEHGAASHKSLKMFLIHAYNLIKYFNKWGWFYDPGRQILNSKTLRLLGLN
jgi:GT2 family glycosyltransferase